MAQPQIVDPKLLYQIGRGTHRPRERPTGMDAIMNFVGRTAINYFHEAWAHKKTLAASNQTFDANFAKTVSEQQGELKGLYSESLDIWREERNKGQSLIAKYHGFPNSKKYKKGIQLVNVADRKMQKLYTDANALLLKKNRSLEIEKHGYYKDAEGNEINAKWHPGTTADEHRMTMMLANGELDKHFAVDENTGALILRRQMETATGESEIESVPFNEIAFSKLEDNTSYDIESTYRDKGAGFGRNGVKWNPTHALGVKADIANDLTKLSPSAFSSYFFGGTHLNYQDGGSIQTPAQAYLAEKFPQYEIGSVEYEGAMETLKNQDLQEQEYFDYAVNSMLETTKINQENALQHHKSTDQRDLKAANIMIGGQLISERDFNRSHLPFIQKLESKEENIPQFNSPKGYTYRKVNGQLEVLGDDGFVPTTIEEVAAMDMISNYVKFPDPTEAMDYVPEDEKTWPSISRIYDVKSVGKILKPGQYEPFEGESGNLISDQNLKIIGINDDGSYQVQDENGEIFNMPKPK